MALGNTYQKYGVRASNPGGLQNSQTATAESLQSALDSVDKLMGIQTERNTNANTLNVQEYFQKNIAQNGLGADPIDTLAVKQKYGNSIDMAAVDKTIETGKAKLVSDAVDKATNHAALIFDQTQDVKVSGEAYKQNLIDQNMRPDAAAELTRDWRQDNQYRVEDIKVADNEALANLNGQLFTAMRDGAGEDAIPSMIADLPPRLKLQATEQLRKSFNSISKMSDDQKIEYESIVERDAQYRTHEESIIQNEIDVAQNAFDAIEVVPDSAYLAVDKINSTLGGLPDAIDTATDNNWIKDVGNWVTDIFGKEGLYDAEAGAHAQKRVVQLIRDRGMAPREAIAIAYQGYNDSAAKSRMNSYGGSYDPQAADEAMNLYLGEYERQQTALANLTAVKRSALDKKFALNKVHSETLNQARQGIRKFNRTGDEFDVQGFFDKRTSKYDTSIIPGGGKGGKGGKDDDAKGDGDGDNTGKDKDKPNKSKTVEDVFGRNDDNESFYDGYTYTDNTDSSGEDTKPKKPADNAADLNKDKILKSAYSNAYAGKQASATPKQKKKAKEFSDYVDKIKASDAEKGAEAYANSEEIKGKTQAEQMKIIQKYTDLGKLKPDVAKILLKKLGITTDRK